MLNKVHLIGRLGKDPEVRHFESDSKVANFTIATNEFYRDKQGNKVEQTEWHNIALWGNRQVEIAEQYLKKGSLIYLEGKIRTRSWEDKDGNKRYTTEVVGDKFIFLDSRKESEDGGYKETAGSTESVQESPAQEDQADDLPF